MAIELYELSKKYVDKVFNDASTNWDSFPEFSTDAKNHICLNDEVDDENHDEAEKRFYFNLQTLDNQLFNEISACGAKNLFEDLDFSEILSKFVPLTEADMEKHVMPVVEYIIVELTYISSYDYYSGGYDYELDVAITGYLDKQLNPIYL
jgi:hypothetical protein